MAEQDIQIIITSDSKGVVTGVRSATGELKKLNKQSATAGKTVKKFGKDATGAMDKLHRSIKRFVGFAAVSMVFSKAFGEADRYYKKLAEITVMMKNTTPQAVSALETKIDTLSVTTGQMLESTEEGAWMLVSAFGESSLATEKLSIAMHGATAGSAEVSETVNLLSANLKGFGDTSDEMAQKVIDLALMTNELGQTSFAQLAQNVTAAVPSFAALGGEIEELYALYATLTGVTGNTSEVTTQLTGAMGALIKPTAGMKNAIKSLGYESVEAMIKENGLTESLRKVLATTDGTMIGMGKLVRRKEALNAVLALIGPQADTFNEKLLKMYEAAGTGEKAFDKMTKGVNKAGFEWMQAKVRLQVFMKDLGKILREVVVQIVKFGDVIIKIGAIIATVFVINKIKAFWAAFQVGTGIVSQLVMGFINLKKYGMSSMDALKGSFRTATGEAMTFRGVMKSIPTSVKITIALVGAYAAGKALAFIFDKISEYHDRGMRDIVDANDKIEKKWSEMTSTILDFRQAGAVYEEVFQKMKKRADGWVTKNEEKITSQRRLLNMLSSTKEWKAYEANMKRVGISGHSLTKALEDMEIVYNSLARSIGNFTKDELEKYGKEQIKLGFLSEKQLKDLEKLRVKAEGLAKEYEQLTASMGLLTRKGYAEQSKEIRSLLKMYDAYEGQIFANEEITKKWLDRITELSKTALPEEKRQLENVSFAIRKYSIDKFNAKKRTEDFSKTIYDLNEEIIGLSGENLPGAQIMLKMWRVENTKAADETENTRSKLEEMSQTFSDLAGLIAGALDAFKKLGVNLGGLEGIIGGVASGFSSMGGGLDAIKRAGGGFTGLLQSATGYMALFSGALTIGASLLKGFLSLFGKKRSSELMAAQENIKGLTGLTQDWVKQLEELGKQLGGRWGGEKAFTQLLGDIIRDTPATLKNFDEIIVKIRKIGGLFQDSRISAEEAAKGYGDAFAALLPMADELNMKSSRAFLDLIRNAKDLGLEVKEISDYISGLMTEYAGHWKTYTDTIETITTENIGFIEMSTMAMFNALQAEGESIINIIRGMAPELANLAAMIETSGLDVSESLKKILDLSTFIEQNKDLANQIDATVGMMQALGDSTYLTGSDFDTFTAEVKRQFDEIIARTGDQELALRLMAPSFESLIKYAESYGYTIGADTQAIIDMGVEAGLVNADQIDYQERQIQLLEQIVELLGGEIPREYDRLSREVGNSTDRMRRDTEEWTDSLVDVGNQMSTLEDSIYDLDKVYSDKMTGHSIVTDTEKWNAILKGVDESIWKIGGSVKMLDNEYVEMFRHIKEGNERYFLSADGVIRSLTDMMTLTAQIKAESEGFGSRYGVYGEYEKIESTTDFMAMVNLIEKHNDEILSDVKNAKNFLEDLKNLEGKINENEVERWRGWVDFLTNEVWQLEGGWKDAIESVDQEFYDLGDTVKILDREYIELTENIDEATRNKWLRALEEIEKKMGSALPEELLYLQGQYDLIMGHMAGSTEQLYLSAEGVIGSLRQILKLQGEAAAPSMGGKYGVYTEAEKQGMTAEFYGMKSLFDENRAKILSDKDAMSNFFRDFQRLEVIDEAKAQYDYWLKSFAQWNAHVQKGHIWNESTRTWTVPEPTKAATGFAAMLTKPTDIMIGSQRVLAGEAGRELLTITPTSQISGDIDSMRQERMGNRVAYGQETNVTDNRTSAPQYTRQNNNYYNTITNYVQSDRESEDELARKMVKIFRENRGGAVTEMSRQQQKRTVT